MIKISLPNKGLFALIDDEDEWLTEWQNWYALKTRNTFNAVRMTSRVLGPRRCVAMHKEILVVPRPLEVDHINGNGLDNRRSNLRPATRRENGRNIRTRSDSSTGVTGVSWSNSVNRWISRTVIPGHIVQRRFTVFEDAVNHRKEMEQLYFGEFVREESCR